MKNNKDILEVDVKKIDPLKTILETQLGMLYNTKNKVNEETKVEEQKQSIEHAKTGLQTQVIENNVPNNFTNSYNGVAIKNGTEYNLTKPTADNLFNALSISFSVTLFKGKQEALMIFNLPSNLPKSSHVTINL